MGDLSKIAQPIYSQVWSSFPPPGQLRLLNPSLVIQSNLFLGLLLQCHSVHCTVIFQYRSNPRTGIFHSSSPLPPLPPSSSLSYPSSLSSSSTPPLPPLLFLPLLLSSFPLLLPLLPSPPSPPFPFPAFPLPPFLFPLSSLGCSPPARLSTCLPACSLSPLQVPPLLLKHLRPQSSDLLLLCSHLLPPSMS